MPESRLHQLSALGQSVWIDFLSRDLLETGTLERMMADDAVCGVTSNPTIFQKAMSEGTRYDDQLRELNGSEPRDVFFELAAQETSVEGAELVLDGRGRRGDSDPRRAVVARNKRA